MADVRTADKLWDEAQAWAKKQKAALGLSRVEPTTPTKRVLKAFKNAPGPMAQDLDESLLKESEADIKAGRTPRKFVTGKAMPPCTQWRATIIDTELSDIAGGCVASVQLESRHGSAKTIEHFSMQGLPPDVVSGDVLYLTEIGQPVQKRFWSMAEKTLTPVVAAP